MSGEFLPRERSSAALTVHASDRSNTTRSAGEPTPSPGRPRRERAPRSVAGPTVSAAIARASGRWPASTAARSNAKRRLDPADPVRGQSEFDGLVDLGVRSVIRCHRVGGAVEERGEHRGRVSG